MPYVRAEIQGRPVLLWALTNTTGDRLECLGGNLPDHQFHTFILLNGDEVDARTCPKPEDGLSWALAREQFFVAQQWVREV